MKESCDQPLRSASWVERIRSAVWPEVFTAGTVVLGIESVIGGRFLRWLGDLAWVLPGAFAVLCWICLGHLKVLKQVRWVALGAGIATGVLTVSVIWTSPLALAFLPAPGWFPWLVLWGVLPGVLSHLLKLTSPFPSALSAVGVLSMAYVLSTVDINVATGRGASRQPWKNARSGT